MYFSQETQFAVARVSNTLVNNDPHFVNIDDVTLIVVEDTGKYFNNLKTKLTRIDNYLQIYKGILTATHLL